MKYFLKNTKGAVTVFITLLLIPAILVSGTAVDLARIHTARSIVQDANQLAANSVLTQYNTLLHDLYGLFGVVEDDPILGELLNEYVKVAVFGDESADNSLGALKLFYGSSINTDDPLFVNGKTLRSSDVLRRQIEEYMKFRGPVIIVKEFLDAVDGNTIKEDTEVINDKMAVESRISDLYDKYKELYDAIAEADKCILAIGGISGGSFASVSSGLVNIREQFTHLKNCYSSWEREEDEDDKDDYEAHYNAILDNIEILIVGGKTGQNWRDGGWSKTGPNPVQGLNVTIENAKRQADAFKQNFDAVVRIAREIDAMHDEISRMVDELERKLNDGECGEEMKAALTERSGNPPMSLIECYREILKWDNIASMATVYKNGGYSYIDNEVKPMLDGVMYRNKNSSGLGNLTRAELASISSNPAFRLSGSVSAASSWAARFADFPADSVTYGMPPGFLKFAEHPGENKAFFEALKDMVGRRKVDTVKLFDGQEDSEEGGDGERKQRNVIDAVLNIVQSAYEGLTNNPIGAKYISDADTPEPEKLNLLEVVRKIPEVLSSKVTSTISDPLKSLADAGDYFLILTYCTSMFSNYTTTRPDSVGKTRDDLSEVNFPDSIAGVPISPEVNYFFQSEWEYLYEGNQDAGKNLSAITTLLFLVRFVSNYIVVFSVSEISTIVSAIRGAFSWAPPLGIILGELARAAFVAAESLIDVGVLRSGHKLPLIKNSGDWVCSPSGLIRAVANLASDALSGEDESKDEKGLSYSNYMLFFFIAKAFFREDATYELVERTGNLIEWNMINYINGVNADEEKMTGALTADDRFRLEKLHTDFIITTSVHMRMLFLSMIFAQNFADGRGLAMPATKAVVVSDYRGY